ncbi:MAG: VOC family virulence protein [Acidimicrobiia bacterium]
MFSIAAGNQKINVHPETMTPLRGNPWYLRGDTAVAGSADLCVVWEGGIDAAIAMLSGHGIEPIEGPVPRIGGRAGGTTVGISVYVRDPDHNLLEFISYERDDVARYQRDQIAR